MPHLPLFYLGQHVGNARVDPELLSLPPLLKWTLSLPRTLRAKHRQRADILLGLLQEDPALLAKCQPWVQLRCGRASYNLKLARVAWNHDLLPLLKSYFARSPSPDTLEHIAICATTLPHLVHLDTNRTNCTRANLRALGYSPQLTPARLERPDELASFPPPFFLESPA